ncbi:GNAT family N-acetyltransferase [Actinokineospora terrae]|uniref:Acetyltransferase (GNAT) domain-containing protein n=1 Tax=Actinokineospora terrae TaxID=155974 RepID=A0A1H9VDG6_9PSEU|nr:GNAT family N-acetyltransferase [Actinokineospora terrae]SES19806.1 Acetyltransferase (GNAT) domain-containing protein [Actinokineospora terrae]
MGSDLDIAAVRAVLDRQLRRDLAPSGIRARAERDDRLTRHVGVGRDSWSGVVWSSLDQATADQTIAATVAWLRTVEGHGEWKLYHHDSPADLGERLTRAGLVAGSVEAVMVAETASVPDFAPPAGVELLDVTSDEDIDRVVRVHDEAFGEDHSRLGAQMRAEVAQRSADVVLAVAGDEAVSAARTSYHAGADFAGLWGGGTREPWRGRGIYRALVSHRARRAQQRGVRYLQVDALPTSRPILERVGFTCVALTTAYTLP